MATSRNARSSGPVVFGQSSSHSGRFPGHRMTSSSAFASYSSAARTPSSSPSSSFFTRSASPTRVNLVGSSSVKFSIDSHSRSISPGRSLSVAPSKKTHQKRTCSCSPTTHPGSFRCALHKNTGFRSGSNVSAAAAPSHRLNARRSAMTNSLVRIGTVEGDLVKRALAALIRPSSHQQRRRASFQPRPSRLSTMSRAEDDH